MTIFNKKTTSINNSLNERLKNLGKKKKQEKDSYLGYENILILLAFYIEKFLRVGFVGNPCHLYLTFLNLFRFYYIN